MKIPTVDDAKSKRDNLGPTGPANLSDAEPKTSEDSDKAGSAPAGDKSYESELENILDRKRAQTPPG